MKEIQSFRHIDQARMKMWPLVGALAAAGLVSAILGGCAMTDRNSGTTGSDVQIRATPLVVRTAKTPEAYYALGKYYFYQGRLEQAKEAFWDAVRLDQGHVDALNGLGVVYDRLGQYDAARKVYEAALLKDPQAAHVWANLGYSLILAGKSSDSIAPLQKAVELDPYNAVARQHLASVSALKLTTTVAAPAADKVQAATAAAQPVAPASPSREGPVASVVTAKAVATVEAKPPQALAMSETLSPAAAAPSKPAQETPLRQAQSAGIQVRETLNQPHPFIASIVKQAQNDGGSIKHEVVSSPAASQESVKQSIAKAPDAEQQAAPAVKAALAATRTEAAASLTGLRIEVSNGNGVTGMARAVGTEMRQTGLNIARITNARPFNKPQTLIVCRPELKSAAMELAQGMVAKPKIVMRDLAYRNVDVRVVLGADSALALKDGAKSPYLVASLGK